MQTIPLLSQLGLKRDGTIDHIRRDGDRFRLVAVLPDEVDNNLSIGRAQVSNMLEFQSLLKQDHTRIPLVAFSGATQNGMVAWHFLVRQYMLLGGITVACWVNPANLIWDSRIDNSCQE